MKITDGVPSGADGDLLRLIAEKLNASLKLITPHRGFGWGKLEEDGTWSGSLADVYYDLANLSMTSASITLSRFTHFQMSMDYNTVKVVWVTHPSTLESPSLKLFRPFDFEVRIALAVSFLLVIVLTMFIRRNCWNAVLGSLNVPRPRRSLVFYSWEVCMGMPSNKLPTKLAFLYVVLFWIWYCFLIRTFYTVFLIKALKTNVYCSDLLKIEDAIAANYGIGGGLALKDYYIDEPTIYNRWINFESNEIFAAMLNLSEGQKYVIAINYETSKIFQRNHSLDLHILPQRVISSPTVIFFKKFSPLADSINSVLTQLVETGFTSKLYKNYTKSKFTNRQDISTVIGAQRVSISEKNVTVVIGRDATLTCNVENLENYKVAWLRVDTQTILTIGQHVITKNHRVAVARVEPHAWALTLREVRPSDTALYMCQINTEPMTAQSFQLHVYVPPDIVDSDSSGEVIVHEGDSIALHCAASGIPKPTITWRREDLKLLTVGGEKVAKWEGAWLNVTSAQCDMNGALFCIASNGVPPSVSKRIPLHVLCRPKTEIIQKMFGVYIGEDASLQCHIKAYPPPKVYWTNMYQDRIKDGSKHETKTILNAYEHTSHLKINNVTREDAGRYHCHAVNSLGDGENSVTLYMFATTTALSTTTGQFVMTSGHRTNASANYELDSTNTDTALLESDAFVVVLSQHQMQDKGVITTS
ncbi:unnamed protein product, partial [Iphiclides podalirius]